MNFIHAVKTPPGLVDEAFDARPLVMQATGVAGRMVVARPRHAGLALVDGAVMRR